MNQTGWFFCLAFMFFCFVSWVFSWNLPLFVFFNLSSLFCSEFRGGPGRLAPLLTAAALLGPPAQLHGSPVGGRGRHQHGAPHSAQLRGEPAEAVLLVGHRLLLHHLPPVRHLLEHLRLRAPRGADTASPLMMGPSPPCSFSVLLDFLQSFSQTRWFKQKNPTRILFYRYFANQRIFSLLLKRDYSSNKYR